MDRHKHKIVAVPPVGKTRFHSNILNRWLIMKTILWWLIAGSKGGINRARIIKELHDRPYNANQLTEKLDLDYKTVRHHLKVLLENRIIESNSEISMVLCTSYRRNWKVTMISLSKYGIR